MREHDKVKAPTRLSVVTESVYGLVGAVHTRDIHRGIQVARQMEGGFAHVNGSTSWDECGFFSLQSKNHGQSADQKSHGAFERHKEQRFWDRQRWPGARSLYHAQDCHSIGVKRAMLVTT